MHVGTMCYNTETLTYGGGGGLGLPPNEIQTWFYLSRYYVCMNDVIT